jgi:hypothetical protein
VYSWFATPQVIVVHRRQIIMNQGKGVDQFDGGGRRVEQIDVDIQTLASGINEQRAYALAAIKDRVTHGVVQALRLCGLRWQSGAQPVIDAGRIGFNPGFEAIGQDKLTVIGAV